MVLPRWDFPPLPNHRERFLMASNHKPPTLTVVPKLSETEASSLVLDSYVLHIQTNLCSCCQCGERYSTLFEVWVHPTQTRLNRFNKLLPVFGTKLDRSKRITSIELPPKPVPFCSDCIHQVDTLAPDFVVVTAISRQAWADTLQRKAQQEHAWQQAASRQRPPAPTLDML